MWVCDSVSEFIWHEEQHLWRIQHALCILRLLCCVFFCQHQGSTRRSTSVAQSQHGGDHHKFDASTCLYLPLLPMELLPLHIHVAHPSFYLSKPKLEDQRAIQLERKLQRTSSHNTVPFFFDNVLFPTILHVTYHKLQHVREDRRPWRGFRGMLCYSHTIDGYVRWNPALSLFLYHLQANNQ